MGAPLGNTWLSPDDFAARFAEIHPPFAPQAAVIEAGRKIVDGQVRGRIVVKIG